MTVEETAIGNVSLDGQTVFRSDTKTTSQVPAPIATTSTGEISSYEIRTGLASLRQLRTESIGTLTGGGNPSPVQTQTVTTYNPAPVNTTGELALGASVELVDKGSRTVTISPGPTTNEVFDDVQVWKFAAISTITVPAGSYETCVFELFEKSTPAVVNKFWILRGRGLLVQSSSSDSQSSTLMQATSIELNGKKL